MKLTSLGLSDATTAALVVGGTVVAVSATVALLTSKPSTNTNYRKIHTPTKQLPVLGDLLTAASRVDDFYNWMAEECVRTNGEPFRMRFLGQPDMVVLSLPEAVEAVTTTHVAKFPKGANQLEVISTLFGRGVLASDGERWYHQRKTAAKFFSAKVLREFMSASAQKTIGRVEALLHEAAAANEPVDLQKIFHDFTLDSFVEMALGVDLNCVSSKQLHPFQEALDGGSPITSFRTVRPRFWWRLERWLGIGLEGKLTAYAATMHDWLSEVIQTSIDKSIAAKKDPNHAAKKTQVKNVIELFLELSHDGAEGIEKEDMIDFVLTFVIAARDTTADTLGWFFYAVGQHPEIERKLRDEMAKKLGTIPRDAYLTPDHTGELQYLEACIKETLRLYPAAPFTFREVAEDTVICDDIFLKKGEQVGMAQFAMGRLPRIWGDDAAEFKPERWIDAATGKIKQVPATQLFAFSAGPRACIGKNLSMLEMRAVIANLLFRFKFDVDYTSNNGRYVVAPTLHMKHPLMTRASRV